MIVDSNSAASLQYVDPTYQTSLFIRANIYDLSGGSPVLDSTVNLLQINNGVYAGKHTFTAGKPYLVQKLVYTDGTYTVVDQTYAQSTDDVQCVDLKTANLDATISSRNSTAHFDAILGTPAVSVSADLAEIEAETDGIAAIPTNPLLTSDVRLNHLDADISTRASQSTVALDATVAKTADARFAHLDVDVSTRLAAASYTAPDNADILLIKAKTDNLPADPASNTQVNTRASQASVNAIPTNPLLTNDVRLNDLDAPISTRLPTSSYVAPDNADIVAIKAKTDNLPALPASEPNVTAVGNAVANVDNDLLGVQADIDDIKTKTDQLLFNGDTGVVAHVINGISVDVEAIADAVWDEDLAEHLGAGSTGAKLNAGSSSSGGVGSQGIVSAEAIQPAIVEADAVAPNIVTAIALEDL